MKLSDLITRYLSEVAGLGAPKRCTLNVIAGLPIGRKNASDLRAKDYIEHCRARRKTLAAATVSLDLSYINGVLIYARVAWEMLDVSSAALIDVKPLLRKEKLIGAPRKRMQRVPQQIIEQMKAHFASRKRMKIPMADIIEFALASGRRISETCRITWGDYDQVRRTVWVRDVKHPDSKDGNDKEAALLPEADAILKRQPRRTTSPDERIFPYHDQSVSCAWIRAKKALGITRRLHDCRGECSTRMMEAGYSVPEIMLVTLHDDPKTLLTRYNKLPADALLKGPASGRTAP